MRLTICGPQYVPTNRTRLEGLTCYLKDLGREGQNDTVVSWTEIYTANLLHISCRFKRFSLSKRTLLLKWLIDRLWHPHRQWPIILALIIHLKAGNSFAEPLADFPWNYKIRLLITILSESSRVLLARPATLSLKVPKGWAGPKTVQQADKVNKGGGNRIFWIPKVSERLKVDARKWG